MRVPLHNKGTLEEVLNLHMTMAAMNPKGFRQPPTSQKNPGTRSNKPQTPIEALARKVYGK